MHKRDTRMVRPWCTQPTTPDRGSLVGVLVAQMTPTTTQRRNRRLRPVRLIAANNLVVGAVAVAIRTAKPRGHVDILVNNAGAAWGAPAEDHPVEAWDKVMNLNVRGYFILSQHIAKHSMIGRRSGSIINVASIAGLGGNPKGMNTIAYNTSKGAVINFTRALAAEWGAYNIRVNAICPGFFPSKMTVGTLKAMGEEALAAHAPLGRLGDDEDLKGLCALYASDAGKHITGQWLAVDGGVSIVTGG